MAAGMTTRARAAALAALAAVLLTAAGCATTDAPVQSLPVATVGPDRTVTPAVGLTRAELVRVLGGQNLVLSDTQAPIRPSESALLAPAPRAVYQVVLPKDPTRGYIVVYEFPDPGRAATAAAEQQAYLATGPGRVQRPQGTVTIIRQVGNTVVYYDWLPGASLDDSAAGIQTALETLGVGFPVPN
jgi:hypothetical protein